ncbi:MAG: hypothetical protein ACFFB3_11320 [Candidatus Hodarchaeota archaeon]
MLDVPPDPAELRRKAQTVGSLGKPFFLIGVALAERFFSNSNWHLAIDLLQVNYDVYSCIPLLKTPS